jgi:myo-inositol-1(or 4)-monophosphatase
MPGIGLATAAPVMGERERDLERIRSALRAAGAILRGLPRDTVRVDYKADRSPITEADVAVDVMLREMLPEADEGWLSEESADDPSRLERRRVWIVDPIDGTGEFLKGVGHWSVSIGLADNGIAVAGGIYNPTSDEMFLGAVGTGVTLNGVAVSAADRDHLAGAVVVMSRWALKKRWRSVLRDAPLTVLAINPLAYSLAIVAAGRADAMWSHSPKWEWDVAAGTALVTAAGGRVRTWDGGTPTFNHWPPRVPGIVASSAALSRNLRRLLRAA